MIGVSTKLGLAIRAADETSFGFHVIVTGFTPRHSPAGLFGGYQCTFIEELLSN